MGYEQGVLDDPKRRIETRLKPHLEDCIRQDVKPIVLSWTYVQHNEVLTMTGTRVGRQVGARETRQSELRSTTMAFRVLNQ